MSNNTIKWRLIYLTKSWRIIGVMATAIKHRIMPKKTNKHKSPYALFVVQRDNYGKRQKKSMVGTTLVVRPSWSEKGNEKQEE